MLTTKHRSLVIILFATLHLTLAQTKNTITLRGYLYKEPKRLALKQNKKELCDIYLKNFQRYRVDVSKVQNQAKGLLGKGVRAKGFIEKDVFVVLSIEKNAKYNLIEVQGILGDEGPHYAIGGESSPSHYIQVNNKKVYLEYVLRKHRFFGQKVRVLGVPIQTRPGVETGVSYRLLSIQELTPMIANPKGKQQDFYGFLLHQKELGGYYLLDTIDIGAHKIDVSLIKIDMKNYLNGYLVKGRFIVTSKGMVLQSIAPENRELINAFKRAEPVEGSIKGKLLSSADGKTWSILHENGASVEMILSDGEKRMLNKAINATITAECHLVLPKKFDPKLQNLGIEVHLKGIHAIHSWNREKK